MVSYHNEFFAAKFIASYFRVLFRGPHQAPAKTAVGPDESWIEVDTESRPSLAVDEPTNQDTKPQPPGAVLQVQPPLPPECPRLKPEDVIIHGDHPTRAGVFADVWDGYHGGVRVVVKSYRLYSTVDSTRPRMRLCKEAVACSLLSHPNIVPFRAAYITLKHPLALVYDFMRNRCLREYVKENRDAKRVRLLVGVARGLLHMHDLGIIHGNLTINNILVDFDGTARIAGLGSAFISTQNDNTSSELDTEAPSYGTAPELVFPTPLESVIQTTKESDIYAFGLLAWEIFAGHVPFPWIHPFGAVYSLTNGDRPPRPSHPDLSDRVWNMIERCWEKNPSLRPPIKTVVDILEEHTPTFDV